MFVTLSLKSLHAKLTAKGSRKLELVDVPKLAFGELGLLGLTVQTRYLTGWDANQLDRLRDAGDKAGCPCLMLLDDESVRLGDPDEGVAEGAADRITRVLRVAHRLGCSGVALGIEGSPTAETLDLTAQRLKRAVSQAERLELNMLISPRAGLTADPERLTALIRKVGGFRIGSLPDFEAATQSGDAAQYLRSLTPHATAILASTQGAGSKGKPAGIDFDACLSAVTAVGYDGTLTLEYRGTGDALEPLLEARKIVEAHAQAGAG